MLKQVLEVQDLMDSPSASAKVFIDLLNQRGFNPKYVTSRTIRGDQGSTDFVRILIPGRNGKTTGGSAPTLGVIGRLGGLGARPEMIGLVSDGDGAVAALSVALKLLDMHARGDILDGDVIVCTHICPNAPTQPHDPVPFMGSPVDMQTMNQHEVEATMDAIVSIDTTKGNKIINHKGISISPVVRAGWILRVSNDLVSIAERVTGEPVHVFPITMQDITPYGNNAYHLNSILQPATATNVPVVGVAITTQVPVAGSATGASHSIDIELAARFSVEVAKDFTRHIASFCDNAEFEHLRDLYGSMEHLQGLGKVK